MCGASAPRCLELIATLTRSVGYHMQSYAHGLLHKDSKHLGIRSYRSTVLYFQFHHLLLRR